MPQFRFDNEHVLVNSMKFGINIAILNGMAKFGFHFIIIFMILIGFIAQPAFTAKAAKRKKPALQRRGQVPCGPLLSKALVLTSSQYEPLKAASYTTQELENHNLPYDAVEVSRKLDTHDILIMSDVIQKHLSQEPQTPMLMVEVLNSEHHQLFATRFILQSNNAALNATAFIKQLLTQYHLTGAERIIRIRHWHPGGGADSASSLIRPWRFSSSDLKFNQAIRDEMDTDLFLQNMKLETFINYIPPNTKPFDASHLDQFWNVVETTGYQVRHKP